MTTTTAAERLRCAAVVAFVLGLSTSPAAAHPGEGPTPYRYVVAPPGVTSEGPAESGVSTQPIGPPGFAGTTDNQVQLTLPEGAFEPRRGQQGVRVQLDQLDPATLPALPTGLEPEGNGYRVALTYASSGAPIAALAAPATLSVSAPAAPTGVLQLVEGRWAQLAYTPVATEAGFGSVVQLDGPMTLMQVYDPASAPLQARASPAAVASPVVTVPPPAGAAEDTRPILLLPAIGASAVVLAGGLLVAGRHRRLRVTGLGAGATGRDGARRARQ